MGNDFLFDMIKNELADVVGAENITCSKAQRITYGIEHFRGTEHVARQGARTAPARLDRDPPINRRGLKNHEGGGPSSHSRCSLWRRLRRTGWHCPPLYGGISMDLKKMNRIISIDEQSLLLTAEAGINGFRLQQEVNRKGLTLAHYPASVYGATLGGYVAARGAGTLSTKYGKAEDMVVKLEAVLPSGEIISTLSVPKHACGPSLLQLLVGSEGTLGVITQGHHASRPATGEEGMACLSVRRLAHGAGSRSNHDAQTYSNRDTIV